MKKHDWVLYELVVLCDSFEKEYYVGKHKGRQVRLNCNGVVDIGDNNFDRWANSIEMSITPQKKKFARQFENAFKQMGV